jgi:hypothetical protein
MREAAAGVAGTRRNGMTRYLIARRWHGSVIAVEPGDTGEDEVVLVSGERSAKGSFV